MRRLPIPPPLPRFDLEDDDYVDDAQPTTVAPWRTNLALATFDEAPKSSDRESGIRALLESELAKFELEVEVDVEVDESQLDDPGRTVTLVRQGLTKSDVGPKTTYSIIAERNAEIVDLAPRLEKQTVPEREDEALGALVAVYEERPTSLPPSAPDAPPAPKPIPRSAVATVRKKTQQVQKREIILAVVRARIVDLVERWSSLDLRVRLGVLLVWTGLCSVVTALLVR